MINLMLGAHLVWLDGLQVDGASSSSTIKKFQLLYERKIKEILQVNSTIMSPKVLQLLDTSESLSVPPFAIKKNKNVSTRCDYIFDTVTTTSNILKILRALQIQKPILLEGSPGIGKSSLVEALAKKIGQETWPRHLVKNICQENWPMAQQNVLAYFYNTFSGICNQIRLCI